MMTVQNSEGNEDARKSPFRIWLDSKVSREIQSLVAVWGRRVLLGGVFAYLFYQLSEIGWAEIWSELPLHPLFYLIFVFMYLGLPVAETFIYRLIWGISFRETFPMMIRKRVFNKDIVNYSGEASLYLWAKNRLDLSGRQILSDIKDNTIISSLTSMLIAFGLLSTFLFTGALPLDVIVKELKTGWLIGGGFCLILLVALALRFRKSVIKFPGLLTRKLFGIHVGRLIFVQTLQVLQWVVIMPEEPMTAWFTFLSAQIIANQIPLVPQKDLLVVAMSPDIASLLEVPESGVTSMIFVTAMLDKIVNFALITYLSIKERRTQADSDKGAAA